MSSHFSFDWSETESRVAQFSHGKSHKTLSWPVFPFSFLRFELEWVWIVKVEWVTHGSSFLELIKKSSGLLKAKLKMFSTEDLFTKSDCVVCQEEIPGIGIECSECTKVRICAEVSSFYSPCTKIMPQLYWNMSSSSAVTCHLLRQVHNNNMVTSTLIRTSNW